MNKDIETHTNTDSMYVWEEKKRYGEMFKLSEDKEIECFSKKQIKALYPKKDYKVVAEHVVGSIKSPAGLLAYKDINLNLSSYKTHNRAVYCEKGFVSIDEDSFIILLKNTIIKRAIFAVLCLALILVGTFIAIDIAGTDEITSINDEQIATGANRNAVVLDLEEDAVDWEGIKSQNTGGVTAGIAIPGYKNITIKAGTTDVKMNLQNPEGNPCYFVISLMLEDGTVLYKSKMIEPGKGLYEIELLNTLEKGEYAAAVKYETYSLDELNPLNGALVKITLIAE